MSGSVTLGVVETSAGCSSAQATASIPILGPPQNLIATASSNSAVVVSWLANGGTSSYEISRRGAGAGFAVVFMTTGLSFIDTPVSANTAYLYAVRAVDSVGNRSAFSNVDLATTVIFTDDPLTAQTMTIKATHLNELHVAIAAMRSLAGLSASRFTDAPLDSTIAIKAIHIGELRTALDEARSALALPVFSYTDAVLAAGSTFVKEAHVRELRAGVK